MTLPALLATLLLAAPEGASSEPPASPAGEAEGWTRGRLKLGLSAGAFDGMGVRTDSGGAALLEVQAGPALKAGAWKLEFPIRAHHFQTFGASLSESYGSASVAVENRLARALRLGATGGLSGAWRPRWPDLYQPVATATGIELRPTDRYGYLAWHAGAHLAAVPFPRNHLRLKYEYAHYGYVRDPNFREADPMHLTPRDNGQHRVEVSWRVLGDGYAATARFGWDRRLDEVYLARHAVSGLTDFYTTPTQRLDRFEPSVEVSLKRLENRLHVSLLYGYQIQSDRFEGYYSYAGHHPRLAVEYAFTERLSARVKGEAWLREYGASSKAAGLPPEPATSGNGHLENGTRLYDRKGAISAAVSYGLTGSLRAKLTGEWVRRSTNYPDYLPGVYPSTKLYDIQWSYVNAIVLAGVELRL